MEPSRFPHPLVLIFAMIVLAQVATWVLPAGEFKRAEDPASGREMVVAGTYHKVKAERLPPYACLTLIPRGLEEGQDVIFFVFIVGGVIAIIRATGAIDAMIGAALKRLGSQPVLLVGGMMTVFALGSATIGMAEEYMPFIPILVTMCLALKMDAVVAMGIVYIGAGVGYGCAALNPYTVLIGQRLAGLPLTSGQEFRWVLLVICLGIGIHHIMRYAKRISNDPSRSLVAHIDYSSGFEMPEDVRFTPARMMILFTIVAGIGVFVWGVNEHGWYLVELTGIFFAIALFAAAAGRLTPNRTALEFCRGAAEMTTTALLIGFARTIQVVLTEGRIIDTVIDGIAHPLAGQDPSIAATGMLAVQSICNFFVPSGSGQAYVTMPIMAPLADLTGVSRQTAVLAYQFGDGFTNMIVPTNALLMGMLALGRIPFTSWVRFIGPLLIKLLLVATIALIVAVRIQY